MHVRTKQLCAAAAAAALLAGWTAEAAAGCTRRISNRSAYLLVVSQDGGPPFTVRPGTSKPIRLSQPGKLDLAVYCSAYGGQTLLDGSQEYVAQSQFTYGAVLDRCYIEFGTQFFVPQLGRGFFGMQGTKPFTLNNPNQGDIILGAFQAECPVISRRG
jgi:hypothetical protein